jgi:hypothetical protein
MLAPTSNTRPELPGALVLQRLRSTAKKICSSSGRAAKSPCSRAQPLKLLACYRGITNAAEVLQLCLSSYYSVY